MTLLALVASSGCQSPASREGRPIFSNEVPQNDLFKQELTFLEKTRLLTGRERGIIEKDLARVEEHFGVPKQLLWCVLFQESRFDPLKNANDGPAAARGLGQFTRTAMDEINEDTDQYDERTSYLFESMLKPRSLPLDFSLSFTPRGERHRAWARLPKQPKTSYFNSSTAVFASGAYLNNRYWQIRHAMDLQGVTYDPELVWLYAAAAYNKGARTVFVLLTQQYLSRGDRALSELLQNPKLSYFMLTRSEVLDHALRDLWGKNTRDRYVEELVRNMQFISSCVLPGGVI